MGQEVLVTTRFAIKQGEKVRHTFVRPGAVATLCYSSQVRPIDDCSRSGINAATAPSEKLHYDGLDTVVAAIGHTREKLGGNLKLWKTDVDAAFRRIPIRPEHRPLAWVAFMAGGQLVAAQHLTLMFGAIASVHHW